MNLKDYLKEQKKTQIEFAKELGVSRTTIHRAINGDPPGRKTAREIVCHTNGLVTYDDIYS